MSSWTIFENSALSQSVEIQIDVQDLKEMDRRLQEYDLLKKIVAEQQNTIGELEKSLDSEKKTNELNEREIDLQKRIIEVQKMEIESQKRAFADMKEVSDRAIKLVEVSKPKSNWQTIAMGILGAIILGILIAPK